MTKPAAAPAPMTEPCFVCEGSMIVVREQRELSLGSRRGIVEVEQYRCEACGETVLSPEQMDKAQRALAGALRLQEGLLPPERIIAFREMWGLSQAQLERLIGVGPKTVVRWERGTVFPNAATDKLLRLIEAVPAALEHLACESGVELKRHTPASAATASRTFQLSLAKIGGSPRRGKVAPFVKRAETSEPSSHRFEKDDLPQISIEKMQ